MTLDLDAIRRRNPANADVKALLAENARLREAIRLHRDQKADDRCWLDDMQLYSALDEETLADFVLPPKCEFLESCSRFWEQRQRPGEKVVASGMTMAQLEADNRQLTNILEVLSAKLDAALRQAREALGVKEEAR